MMYLGDLVVIPQILRVFTPQQNTSNRLGVECRDQKHFLKGRFSIPMPLHDEDAKQSPIVLPTRVPYDPP